MRTNRAVNNIKNWENKQATEFTQIKRSKHGRFIMARLKSHLRINFPLLNIRTAQFGVVFFHDQW